MIRWDARDDRLAPDGNLLVTGLCPRHRAVHAQNLQLAGVLETFRAEDLHGFFHIFEADGCCRARAQVARRPNRCIWLAEGSCTSLNASLLGAFARQWMWTQLAFRCRPCFAWTKLDPPDGTFAFLSAGVHGVSAARTSTAALA